MYGANPKKWGSSLHFEELWTENEECGDIMKQACAGGENFNKNLASCIKNLAEWSKNKFHVKFTILKN